MNIIQPGILAPPPRHARYLFFSLDAALAPHEVLQRFKDSVNGETVVAGLGRSLLHLFDSPVKGLHGFPRGVIGGVELAATPAALWCWLRDSERGELVHRTRAIQKMLSPSFQLEETIDAFQYAANLDLSGYEDGTENPQGEQAEEVAIVHGQGAGLDGSSFVAVQKWRHDLDKFESFSAAEQDNIIGRRKSDNEELQDAPLSAHVKRTAQESFEPEAFLLRRSMPWADAGQQGLVFAAFGKSFDAFEALLARMLGEDDAITDALFSFSRPVSGSYFWCPPMKEGGLDLSLLGL